MLRYAKGSLAIVLLSVCFTSATAQAQVAVIGHKSSTVEDLSLPELKRIYSGEVTTFTPVCVQEELGDAFFEAVIGKSSRAVKKLWVKAMLSGSVPQGLVYLNSDEDVLEYIRKHAGAIGFINSSSTDDTVKVIKKIS